MNARNKVGLLARGGCALIMAVVAKSRGKSVSSKNWHVLSGPLKASVQQIMLVLEEGVDREELSKSVAAAMSAAPPVAPPSWTQPFQTNGLFFARLGERMSTLSWPPGSSNQISDDKKLVGIACVAVALARNIDTAKALASRLDDADARALVSMTRLAHCTVGPGEPSMMRARIKSVMEVMTFE